MNSTTTAAQPCGKCWRCGGQLYALLAHHCQTSIAPAQISIGSGK